ncbi:MAG: hypothetical protein WD060_14035 [Pirellulales bacterium]
MNAISPLPKCPTARDRAGRGGITLLEVLVACGILVVGLAGIAAVLPAAGSRLAQASLEDRAGAAAANAYAEIVNRGLIAVDLFGSGTTKACVFGRTLPTLATTATASNFIVSAMSNVLQARIDSTRGFQLEDELIYTSPTIADTPNNSFTSGNVGPRAYRSSVCWGAMLTPAQYPAAAGGVATLSIAVFKKPGNLLTIQLSQTNGLYQMVGPDEAIRKAYLPGCSYVLATPLTPMQPPKWFKINSSWNNGVVFADSTFPAFAGPTPTVIGFENLIRVDQYPVSLD